MKIEINVTELLPLTKAAEYLGVSKMTLWRWTQQGKVSTLLLDHHYYPVQELDKLKK